MLKQKITTQWLIKKHFTIKHTINQRVKIFQESKKNHPNIKHSNIKLLAYMAINVDFDDNKLHVLVKQKFMYCAFIIRK